MNKLGIILILTMLTLTGFWVWTVMGQSQTQKSRVQEKLLTKQSDERGGVTVAAEPIFLEAGKEASFKIVLDTHNVELDYDLLKVSTLSDEKGNSFKPLSWSGGSGGHHLKGDLVFPAFPAKAKLVQLLIAGISGFDRRFIWNL